jgi:hypothetical protein
MASAELPPPFPIDVDYPVDPVPRYGWGQAAHPQLAAIIEHGRDGYYSMLERFGEFAGALSRIPRDAVPAPEPFWNNVYFQGLDLVALYALLALRNPPLYIEIGSGYSTRVARRAIADQKLRTSIVCIDPNPRSDVRRVADEYIASSLSDVELGLFDRVTKDDIVLFDGSHVVFMNSDVTVLFTELLPRLPAGVLLQVHDIFLPWDYRPDWARRWYAEQYLLASWLLGGSRLKVLLPNFFIFTEPQLFDATAPIWETCERNGPINRKDPSAFWLELAR